jgi:archaellin
VDNNKDDYQDDTSSSTFSSHLKVFHKELCNELQLNFINEDTVTVHIFDPQTETFQELTSINQIPRSSCRLRIQHVVSSSTQQQKQQQNQSSSSSLLALPWKEFGSINLSDGSFRIDNKPLRIEEVSNTGLGTGLNVWDGSIVLSKYLESHKDLVNQKNVLEVGSGTGVVGIVAAILGATKVILTDLDYSIDNLQNNITLNKDVIGSSNSDNATIVDSPVDAKVLDWFHPEACQIWAGDDEEYRSWIPDIILASDVVWIESLVIPLVQTLHYICCKDASHQRKSPLILMSYQCRSKVVESILLETLTQYSFLMEELDMDKVKSERIQLFRITYQSQSK